MPVATTYASAEFGIDAPLITVEVDVSSGLPQTRIVGLPETAVRESKDRVKAAIVSSGFVYPSKRITVNLAPADMPKQGGRYDLAIAIAILAASKQIATEQIFQYELLGELSLTGSLRPISGVLPALVASRADNRAMILPMDNVSEASLSGRHDLHGANDLREVAAHLTGQRTLEVASPSRLEPVETKCQTTLADVKGQLAAKRALTIAAAGAHNLLMIGPPGTGKTMLAQCMTELLPDMTTAEALETATIASVSNLGNLSQTRRPFRSPHHTASPAAIVGGGNPPKPGEVSLAHLGILFLDELPEFSRQVLEVLREPLESGEVWISRASAQVRYPARFQLIAAMNPCPCGYAGDGTEACDCSPDRVSRYRSKVSGPLLDRIDLHVDVPAIPRGTFLKHTNETARGNELVKKVSQARNTMLGRQGMPNAHLSGQGLKAYCDLDRDERHFLDEAIHRLGISARGYFKILKVARTIADLEGAEHVTQGHIIEALGYRTLDRKR